MQDHEIVEFSKKWNIALETKGQKPISAAAMKSCFDSLAQFDLQIVKSAIDRFKQTSPYHLQPSVIFEIISGHPDAKSNMAWMQVRKIATSVGGFDDLILSDTISMAVIRDMGGLQRLTELKTDFELSEYSRQFTTMYKTYSISGVAYPCELLPGRNNSERKRFGMLPNPARRIDQYQKPVELPDFSKPRYEQISISGDVSPEQSMKMLSSFIVKKKIGSRTDEK